MSWFFGHRGTLTLLSFIIKPCTLPLDQSPVELPEPMEESSIEDPSILNLETVGPTELTYRIVEEGTKRRRAGGRVHIPFYLLIQQLHKEAMLTAVQVRLVSDRKLRRIQRRVYRRLQAKIFDLWDEYASNAKTAAQLLKACSYLSGPVRLS